jgi:hypothetical protein
MMIKNNITRVFISSLKGPISKIVSLRLGDMVRTCNLSYLGGRDQEDVGLKSA